MRREVPKKPDPLVLLVRANAGKRARRSPGGMLLAALILLGVLTLIAWWSWPVPDPPALQVVAFDQVTRPGEKTTLRAVVHPEEEQAEHVDLSGYALDFAAGTLGAQSQSLREAATTDAAGQTSVRWKLPASDKPASLMVKYAGDKQHRDCYDAAHVFTWPADARILLVEARHGLLGVPEAEFRKANIHALKWPNDAARALAATAEKGYHVAYLLVAEDRPEDYRKLRGWLQRIVVAGGTSFPAGPALGRLDYGDSNEAAARREVLRALKQSFKGPLTAVAGTAADARALHEAGLKTYLVGGKGDVPEGIIRVHLWKDLASRLP
jgi:hypothetical protein